ncbi:MAG: thermonuclease family protein [Defluviicoccus sp.]|nr:thermonuclease family protein [Defluviicoccus sp.]
MGKGNRRGCGLVAFVLALGCAAGAWGQTVGAEVGEHRVGARVQEAKWGAESDPDAIRSGDVVRNPAGEFRVIVAARFRPEIWKIEDDGEVTDVGYFVASGVGGSVRVEWEQSSPVEWPLVASGVSPWKRTGQRFAAFRLMDWVMGNKAPVGLPFFGRDSVAFEFGKAGLLQVGLKEGGVASGRWWWSKGRLHIEVEGLKDVATYEWKSLASKLGWSPALEGPAVVGPVVAPLEALRRKTARDRVVTRARDGCPKDVLHRLLSEAAERSDVVSAIAIEKETIALCAERQSVVADLLKAEGQIEDALARAREKRSPRRARRGIRSVAQLVGVDLESDRPEPQARKQRGDVPDPVVVAPAPQGAVERPKVVVSKQAGNGAAGKPAAVSVRRFSWFSLLGRKGALVAGVTDGRRVWFVGEGDVLPGNRRVQRIAGHPPGVRVAGLGLLPWAGKAGASGSSEMAQEASGERGEERATPEIVTVAESRLAGKGRVLDGDTLDVASVRVRLWGIDAPESRQRCRAGGRWWSCGGLATAALRARAGNVECERRGKDAYGRVLGVCFERGEDINGWMVAEGWALAYRRFAKDYVPHENRARNAAKGVHRGEFVNPWDWRRGVRLKPVAAGGETRPTVAVPAPGAVGAPVSEGLPPLPETGGAR